MINLLFMAKFDETSRGSGAAFGTHRVIHPQGALPQAAEKLDNRPGIFDNELQIAVDTLHIDSASFSQMMEQVKQQGGASMAEGIETIILQNIEQRGKQINSITGSGGMLMGRVSQVGKSYHGPEKFQKGDEVATLVSLTLTPLLIDRIKEVHVQGNRKGQVDCEGTAIVFSDAPVSKIPKDLPREVALSILDVCGAPAQVKRMVQPKQNILILGAGGKSGLLCLAQARKSLGKTGVLMAIDYSNESVARIEKLKAVDHVAEGNAQNPMEIYSIVSEWTKGRLCDLVINTANVRQTEMATILSCRSEGTAYFFNMATSFPKATLGAEGIGKDVLLVMGNGFTPGHAQLSLDLVREDKTLLNCFRSTH